MPTRLRTPLSTALAVLVAALTVGVATTPAAGVPATAEPPAPRVVQGGPDKVLDRAARGASAIDRLGADITTVAQLNRMSVRDLERLLLEDRAVWVHPTGRLYYVDPAPEGITAEAPAQAPYPYDQTFQLHSKPGSSRTIYLDFDGQLVAGTGWNEIPQFLLAPLTHPAFSLDANPAFSNAERDVVQSVWQRVSEDYAPFDVDVTTADPGIEALRRSSPGDTVFGTRALITPSAAASQTLCNNQCGGIAFIGTFGDDQGSDYYQPAWVFPQALSFDTKAIAEAATHEVGHNLGLEHDGTAGQDYYAGQGAWAPIMGSGYDRPISQWSKGEYNGANNQQDDLTVITQNGLSVVPDDHGNTVGGATVVASQDRTATGLVTTAADRDMFAFPQGCAGPVTVTVTPAPTSPNLDVRLRLLSADGSQLAVGDPASGTSTYDVATGMGATASTTVADGSTLYAEVDGTGAGNPATNGYSDYASLGRYTISSTGCSAGGGAIAFEQGTGSVGEGAGTTQLTVLRTGDTTTPASVAYAVTGGTATAGQDFGLSAGTLSFPAGVSQASIPVQITDDTVAEPAETVEVTLSSPTGGVALGTLKTTTLTITDNDEVVDSGRPDLLVSGRQASGFIGDDVYNTDGAGQSLVGSARRGQVATFYVRVTNDGPTQQPIIVTGSKGKPGSKVTYVNGGNDVTDILTSPGGGEVPLGPGEFAVIQVNIKILKKAAFGSKKPAVVTARWFGDEVLSDVVKGKVKVVRR